jgi:dTDP-4-amino-4,6-dideoxygalactose transaminase
LTDAGVETAIHYPTALPFLPCYDRLGHKAGDFPVAHCYQNSILSLPLFPELQDDALAHVCATIKKSFHG